jgi:hypothetical protein
MAGIGFSSRGWTPAAATSCPWKTSTDSLTRRLWGPSSSLRLRYGDLVAETLSQDRFVIADECASH